MKALFDASTKDNNRTLVGATPDENATYFAIKIPGADRYINAYHNEAIITIRPVIDKEYAIRNYLFKVLPLIANLGESKDAIKGKTLNSKSLANLLIPLPPLQEQQRIIERINLLSKQLR